MIDVNRFEGLKRWVEIRYAGSDDDEASFFLDALGEWLSQRDARVIFERNGVVIERDGLRVQVGFARASAPALLDYHDSVCPKLAGGACSCDHPRRFETWPAGTVLESRFEVLMRAIAGVERRERRASKGENDE